MNLQRGQPFTENGNTYIVTDIPNISAVDQWITCFIKPIFYYQEMIKRQPISKDFTPLDWVDWWTKIGDFKPANNFLPTMYEILGLLTKQLTKEQVMKESLKCSGVIFLVKDKDGNTSKEPYVYYPYEKAQLKFLKEIDFSEVKVKIQELNTLIDDILRLRLTDKSNTLQTLIGEYFEPLVWKYYYEWVQKYGINFVFSSYFPGCPLVKQKDGSYYYNNTLMDDTEIKNTIVLKSTSSKEKIRKYILNTMNVDSMTPMQYTIMTSIKKLINDTKEKY